MKTGLCAAAILMLAGTPALAHRLDEYLQGAIISVGKNRVDAQVTLTPGVAIFPALLAEIDTDADGVISAAEQRAYAGRILRDLSLRIDGHALTPRLRSILFPPIAEMREGSGEIRLEFDAALPDGGPDRKLVLENHHLSRISAYQVNCLASRDPAIRIRAQNRNESQSFYELEFTQAGAPSNLLSLAWLPAAQAPLEMLALLLVGWLALLWRQRA